MDLTLTEDQKMLQSTVQELMRRDFPKETLVELDAGKQSIGALWAKLASTGLLGSLVPEEYGGIGGSLTDTAVIYEELGRGPVPGPHFSSGVLGGIIAARCCHPGLPGCCAGKYWAHRISYTFTALKRSGWVQAV